MKKYIERLVTYVLYGTPQVNVVASVSQLAPNERLKGKNIMVTGGGRGLGFYIAKKCVEEGAIVLITGRNEKLLGEASVKLGGCRYLKFDVGLAEDIPVLFHHAVEMLGGRIDCLVNNAGISLHEGSFREVTVEGFEKQFNINLKGAYFLAQAFADHLEKKESSDGNIVFITSERGLYGDDIPYGLTKVAVNSLTRGLSRHLLPGNIRVNAVAPGVTASAMTGYSREGNLYREDSCGKRVFLPEEIAEVVVFLLSDVSQCISGEVIACNQGNHLRCDV